MRLNGVTKALGCFLLAGVLALPAFSAPDTRAPAQPGTVNYIEGQAAIGGQSLNQNSVGAELLAGQTLTTQNGRAEILLTPGVLLRLDHNSAITMDSPDLAAIHLTLQQGRAIVEADQVLKENDIAIRVGNADARMIKSGLYEFNASTGDIRVYQGQINAIINDKKVEIKGSHQLALNDVKLKSRGFDKKQGEDEFYRWASLRSSYLAEANVNTARMYATGGAGWYGPGWYWSPWFSAYTWLPGDGIFWDPFGWGFFAPGFVGYAPLYGFGGFGYYGGFHHFGPGYHPPVAVRNGFARGFGGPVNRGGFGGGYGGGFHGNAVGGGFHGGFGGGGFHGGGGGRGR